METLLLQTQVSVYACDELPVVYRELVERAKQQALTAYAPYSHFKVGAAVLLDNGEIITGSNQENAAYPSGICAERTVLFYANARYPQTSVQAIAIAAYNEGHYLMQPISPCGACRQVMLETEQRYGGRPIDVLLYGEEAVYLIKGAEALLPFSFVSKTMGKNINP